MDKTNEMDTGRYDKIKDVLSEYLPKKTAEKIAKIIDEDTPILITGKHGPTGKTTLCEKLKHLGYNAQEKQLLGEGIDWDMYENGENSAYVLIFLNKYFGL